jgi:hypothetical protein
MVLFRDRRRATVGVAQAVVVFFSAKARRVPSAQSSLTRKPSNEDGLAALPVPRSKKWF